MNKFKLYQVLIGLLYNEHDFIVRVAGNQAVVSTVPFMNFLNIHHRRVLRGHLEELELHGYVSKVVWHYGFFSVEITEPLALKPNHNLPVETQDAI